MTKKIEQNISGKVPQKFSIGDKVYAKNLYGDKWLAAEVIKVSGPLSYQVKVLSKGALIEQPQTVHLELYLFYCFIHFFYCS